MVPWAYPGVHNINGISIGSTVFARLIFLTNSQTHRQADHATCVTIIIIIIIIIPQVVKIPGVKNYYYYYYYIYYARRQHNITSPLQKQ